MSIAPGAVLAQLAAGFFGTPPDATWLVGGRALLPSNIPVSFWAVALLSAANVVAGYVLRDRAADTRLPLAVVTAAVLVPALYVLLRVGAVQEVARILVFEIPALAIGSAFGLVAVGNRAAATFVRPMPSGDGGLGA